MELVKCEVSEGPRVGFKAVGVSSIEGFTEFLTIEERFLVVRDGSTFLPVRLIGRDQRYDTALVQLPVEADSGANRVWVRADNLVNTSDGVPA